MQNSFPYSGYSFLVRVDGAGTDGQSASGTFSEVTGLGADIQVVDYREGNDNNIARKFPGMKKYANITFKRGISADIEFWNWILSGVKDEGRRVDGSILLFNESWQEVMRWKFRRGWASKYTGAGLNAANNEIALETLEISHEGLVLER